MDIPRIDGQLEPKKLGNTLVFYGKGITDEFIGSGYVAQNFTTALYDALRAKGYERIIFYSLQRGIFFYDARSRDLSLPSSPRRTESPRRVGVLGRPQLRRAAEAPPEAERPTAISDERSFSLLNTFMKESSPLTAVVFLHTEGVFQHVENRRMLYSYANEWMTLVEPNRNLCCWVYAADSLSEVHTHLKENFPALHARIKQGLSTDSPFSLCLYVGAPDAVEIRRLVTRMRLQGELRYDWKDIDRLTEYFAARNLLLRDWHSQFLNHEITRKTAVENKWLETALSDKSAVERLDELIGLSGVKEIIKKFERRVRGEQQLGTRSFPHLHMVFQGNPGTGKTTVARLLGEMYRELGLLKRGHVREVASLADIVSEHVGGTSPRMNQVVDEALDGVLFIDEAYQLADEENPFAREALNTLMTRMENDSRRLAVVLAGYPDEMQRLLKANPGLERRFSRIVSFEDYTAEELYSILRQFLEAASIPELSSDMADCLRQVARGMYAERDRNFGNAGEMRNLSEQLYEQWMDRCMRDGLDLHTEPLERADLPETYHHYEATGATHQDGGMGAILDELDEMVGMREVREHIESMVNLMKLNRRMGNSSEQTLHLVFSGRPGTGKTTVAKKMGRIYHAMGYLPTPRCIDASPKDIIGRHVGDTENNAEELFQKALGGVLFFDEAYQYATHTFGQNFIDSLVRFMDAHRDSLAVVIAGYPDKIDEFLDSNEGLRSRFKNRIEFPDYTAGELGEIVARMAAKEKIGYTEEVRAVVVERMRLAATRKDFSNGRTARNLFEDMKKNLANRLYGKNSGEEIQEEAAFSFTPDDIPEV